MRARSQVHIAVPVIISQCRCMRARSQVHIAVPVIISQCRCMRAHRQVHIALHDETQTAGDRVTAPVVLFDNGSDGGHAVKFCQQKL